MSDIELVRCALSIAREQLRDQKKDLWSIRSQASLIAAVSGLTATFFSRILKDDTLSKCWQDWCIFGMSPALWIVLLSFLLAVFYASKALMGWKDCTFELNPNFILHKQLKSVDEIVVLRELARDADRFFDENENVLDDAKSSLKTGVYFIFAQFFAWVLYIVS